MSVVSLPRKLKLGLRLPFRALRLEGPIHANLRVLRDVGWLRSYREQRPVTRNGEPLPWYTYSAIEFLGERLPPDAAVFEYGAGNSTLWYARRAARVVAVDPSREWVRRLTPALPPNAHVVCHPYPEEKDEYLDEITKHDGPWDLVAIDSAWREESGEHAIENLTSRGVIVWDNSSLPEFQAIMRNTFAPAGFKELAFGGLVPIVPSFDRTSILYRPDNLLGI